MPDFDEVYDAEDGLRAKKYMSKMRSTQIKEGDIVVVEASIIRWASSGKDTNDENENKDGQPRDVREKRTRKRVWENWRVEFKLESLWFVYPGSKHVIASKGLSEDVEL